MLINNIWGENGHGQFDPADPADPARAYSFAGGGASEPLLQRHLRRASGAQRRIALPEDGVVRSFFLLLLEFGAKFDGI